MKTRKGIPIYYWDSCIFLTYIKAENDQPDLLAAVDYYAEEFKKGNCIITTSTITRTEIIEINTPPEAYKIFQKMWDRIEPIGAFTPIYDMAEEIRNKIYITQNVDGIDKKKLLSLFDAVHLSSAIWLNKVKEFHTKDDGKCGRDCGILTIAREIEKKYGLKVLSPILDQPGLFPPHMLDSKK